MIHAFTQSIGKENFYFIGEITGGRSRAFQRLETTGLDAALGVDDIPDKMEYLVKGYRKPEEYFQLFRNSILVRKESHVWFCNRVVTLFDDHDQVRKGENTARFCADPDGPDGLLNVLALNALTMGFPCMYYGSEQYFDGTGRVINSFANVCSAENSAPFKAINGIFSMKRVRPTGNSLSYYAFAVTSLRYDEVDNT